MHGDPSRLVALRLLNGDQSAVEVYMVPPQPKNLTPPHARRECRDEDGSQVASCTVKEELHLLLRQISDVTGVLLEEAHLSHRIVRGVTPFHRQVEHVLHAGQFSVDCCQFDRSPPFTLVLLDEGTAPRIVDHEFTRFDMRSRLH